MRNGPGHDLKYGRRHRNLREQWRPVVEAGDAVCVRCGKAIRPWDRWVLGHVDDAGPADYQGPEHAACSSRSGLDIAREKAAERAGQAVTEARDKYAVMERRYELQHFGRVDVPEGALTVDAAGRVWRKTGHIVAHAWWLTPDDIDPATGRERER